MPQENKDPENKVDSPTDISLSGWKAILTNVKDQIKENNVIIVSAGVGFFGFLAIFPGIMALVSIFGLTMDPQLIDDQLSRISYMVPEEVYGIIEQRVENFINTSGQTLGWGTAAGILFAIWSANKGTKSLFTGVDIAYKSKSKRGFIKQNALTLLFTFGAIILLIFSAVLIVAFPAIVDKIGLPENVQNLISWMRWLIMALISVCCISLIYLFAPERPRPKIKWVLTGALVATFLWLIASWGFSFFISNFANYGEIYGSISAVVVLMLWLYLTSFIILLGAELNSEMEKYSR
jgi:membrane protein